MGHRFGGTAEKWGKGLEGLLRDGAETWRDC